MTKVEMPGAGDDSRACGPFANGKYEKRKSIFTGK
jgi:hypothetical protein